MASPSLSAATDEILGFPGELSTPSSPVASAIQSQINDQIAAKQAQDAKQQAAQQAQTAANLDSILAGLQNQAKITQPSSLPTSPFGPRAQEAQAPVGIMSTPQATAANVVGLPDELSTPAMSSTMAPATSTSAPVADPNAPGQLSPGQLAALDANTPSLEDAETDVVARDLTDPNRPGYQAGLPTGLEFTTTPGGVRATTNLAGTTAAQRAEAPGFLSTIDPVTGEVKEGFIPGAVNMVFGNPIQQAYGFEIPDPTTGEITGVVSPPAMSLPGPLAAGINFLADLVSPDPTTLSSSEELLTSMPSVYTGFGPGSELGAQDPDAGGRTDPPKAPNDPCPPGFQMINGTCTPVDQREEDTGTDFQINPVTGLPTLFNPFTQATPFAGANPFALQPYTPNQAQYIQEQRSGLQALSPTGAALGKQV